jgi:phosphoglycolate phosphatase
MLRGVTEFEAIVFDLDGTLVNSLPDMAGALNRLLADNGHHALNFNEIRPLIGSGVTKMIQSAYELIGIKIVNDDLVAAIKKYVCYYKQFPNKHSEVYDGVIETLDYLQAAGIKMGICSNKSHEMVNCILEVFNLTKYFCGVTGGDSVVFNKPDGRHILETLKLMDVSNKNALMVGDTIKDVVAAQNAGIPVVAVDYGYSGPGEILSATVIIDQFGKLKSAII